MINSLLLKIKYKLYVSTLFTSIPFVFASIFKFIVRGPNPGHSPVPAHLVRWMAAFLLDREQRVKIGDAISRLGYPNGGIPHGTLYGPKHFLVNINGLRTPCHIYKYVDDSTIFEICNQSRVSVIQDSANITAQWTSDNDMRINTSKTK